jgi:hypothetical protein
MTKSRVLYKRKRTAFYSVLMEKTIKNDRIGHIQLNAFLPLSLRERGVRANVQHQFYQV